MSKSTDDPISPAIQAVLDLFEEDLAAVKFADVDRQVLGEDAEKVRERAQEVRKAEAVLAAAREALQESQDALTARCQRGLAYARIYAEDNEELIGRLEGINLPRRKGLPLETPEVPKNGKRSRKGATPSGGLFVEEPGLSN